MKILKHPFTIILSIIIGVLFGRYCHDAAIAMAPIGTVYLNFFQMCVIPIIITAIISSLAMLMKNQHAKKYIKKIVFIFISAIFFISIIGTLLGLIGKPGADLDKETLKNLGKIIIDDKSEKSQTLSMSLLDPSKDVKEKKTSLLEFFINIVPQNIFNSLGFGKTLEIVFFAIIFGIVLGFIKDQSSQLIIDFSKSLLEAFQKLIYWTMFGLPFGLIFLIGNQIALVGTEVLMSMIKFIVIFHIGGLIIFIIASLAIWYRSRENNPLKVLKAILDPIIISLATRNSLATLPSSISALENTLKFNSTTVNLVLPLGTTILRFGNIYYFALAACFVTQIYGASIDVSSLIIIIVGAVFAGTATAGASGLLTLPMISIILSPMGLPVEAILVIFIAIDTIIDPMRTFLIVYGNLATTALIADRD